MKTFPPSLALASLFMLALSIPAFCGEIHDAVKGGDLARVKALLKNNPKLVSSKDNKSRTPLHLASENGHKDFVELPLDKGARVNAKDEEGNTPLHMAAFLHRKDLMELLLAKGADVTQGQQRQNAFSLSLGACPQGHR